MDSEMENQNLKTELRKMPMFFLSFMSELELIASVLYERYRENENTGMPPSEFVELLRRVYNEKREEVHREMLAVMEKDHLISEGKAVDNSRVLNESIKQVWMEVSPLLEGDLLEIPQIMEIVNPI